jgi:type II secretory pathway pseudopilin PulG
MPTPTTSLRHDDDGFTLVELLVAMTLSIVVLLATLQSLDVFSSNAAEQSRVTDADQQLRLTMDNTVRDLRGASTILRAGASDLVYTVPVTSASTRIQRLCVASGYLYGSTATTSGTPVAPTAACSSGVKIASLPSTSSTAFSYDGASSSATPALVKNVGLTFGLDASGGGKSSASTLSASAARRAAGTLPITGGDVGVTCNSSGALLSLGVGLPGTGALTVTYANSGGISLGTPSGTTLQIPKGITTVLATVTDSLGVTNTVKKDVECD